MDGKRNLDEQTKIQVTSYNHGDRGPEWTETEARGWLRRPSRVGDPFHQVPRRKWKGEKSTGQPD